MSESLEKTRSLAEIKESTNSLRRMFLEKYGQTPQDIEFTEGEEALAEFYDVLLSFSYRPKTFFNGSFDGFTNFLHGAEWGLKFGREPIPCLKVVTNRGFAVWLADHYSTARNIAWSSALLKIYPDEAEAIVQIPILFARYLHELRTRLWSRENGPVKKRPRRRNNRDDA